MFKQFNLAIRILLFTIILSLGVIIPLVLSQLNYLLIYVSLLFVIILLIWGIILLILFLKKSYDRETKLSIITVWYSIPVFIGIFLTLIDVSYMYFAIFCGFGMIFWGVLLLVRLKRMKR